MQIGIVVLVGIVTAAAVVLLLDFSVVVVSFGGGGDSTCVPPLASDPLLQKLTYLSIIVARHVHFAAPGAAAEATTASPSTTTTKADAASVETEAHGHVLVRVVQVVAHTKVLVAVVVVIEALEKVESVVEAELSDGTGVAFPILVVVGLVVGELGVLVGVGEQRVVVLLAFEEQVALAKLDGPEWQRVGPERLERLHQVRLERHLSDHLGVVVLRQLLLWRLLLQLQLLLLLLLLALVVTMSMSVSVARETLESHRGGRHELRVVRLRLREVGARVRLTRTVDLL